MFAAILLFLYKFYRITIFAAAKAVESICIWVYFHAGVAIIVEGAV